MFPFVEVDKKAILKNGKLAKWQAVKMASWQNIKLAKWRVGKMASWQNGVAPFSQQST